MSLLFFYVISFVFICVCRRNVTWTCPPPAPSIDIAIIQHWLPWVGHQSTMCPTRLSRLSSGKGLQRGPKRRFKDPLKTSLRQANIDPARWEIVVESRSPLCRSWKWGSRLSCWTINIKSDVMSGRPPTRPHAPRPQLLSDSGSRLFRLVNHNHLRHRHPSGGGIERRKGNRGWLSRWSDANWCKLLIRHQTSE